MAARWAWRRGSPDLRCRAAISGWFRGGGERNLGGDRVGEEEESRRGCAARRTRGKGGGDAQWSSGALGNYHGEMKRPNDEPLRPSRPGIGPFTALFCKLHQSGFFSSKKMKALFFPIRWFQLVRSLVMGLYCFFHVLSSFPHCPSKQTNTLLRHILGCDCFT